MGFFCAIFRVMKKLFIKYKDMILYVFFGCCTTVINFATYYAFTRFLGIDEFVSNAIAWVLAVLFAFFTNKLWVFNSKSWAFRVALREFSAFVAARLLSLLLDMGVLWLGITVLHINDLIVKVFSNVLVILLNYIASKFYIFKKT